MDLAADAPATDSTVLDPNASVPGGSGGGTPNLRDQMRDTVADAVAKASEAADKADAAPKDAAEPEVKPAEAEAKKAPEKAPEKPSEPKAAPERGADGKFAGTGKPADDGEPKLGADKPNGADKGDNIHAPARFMPDAREKWTNTPRAVQRDVEHAFREHEAELTKYREAAERYEPIRQYDDYVRQNGRAGVHETLAEVAQLEDLMGKNPIAAVNQILQRAGPRKADGSPVSLREFVQTVAQMDQAAYNRAVAPQQQQSPQNDNPRIQQLEQQLAQMQVQHVASSVIEPFKRDHPRYDELSPHIAKFLKSGMVPDSLSAPERLAVAYDMAERLYPPSGQIPAADGGPADERRADEPSAATSIKTAPGAVTPVEEPKRGGTARDEVERVIRRMTQTGGR